MSEAMSELSAERIQEIRERVSQTTDGPWNSDGGGSRYVKSEAGIIVQGHDVGSTIEDEQECVGNMDFIAHSRQDIPDLLDEIEKYRQCLSDLRNQLCMCSAPDNKPCHWCGVIDAALKENELPAAQPIQQGEGK